MGTNPDSDESLADRAIDDALRSTDPRTAAIGAIAVYARSVAFALAADSFSSNIAYNIEQIAHCMEDDNGEGVAENLRKSRSERD